ncbi:hypothetical protein XHV734_4435 [Xanthomonas hortorum pv. vitians]|nr:hypothetical protein XHV734_4435 [Xanthomonas hortorum pv. vitians]
MCTRTTFFDKSVMFIRIFRAYGTQAISDWLCPEQADARLNHALAAARNQQCAMGNIR